MGHPFPKLAKKQIAAGVNANNCAAVVLYACLGIFLYLPQLTIDNKKAIICGFNTIAAAWGAYFISKRWVNNWTPSLFTGFVYGFGPYALSFEVFHPLAGLSIYRVSVVLHSQIQHCDRHLKQVDSPIVRGGNIVRHILVIHDRI